MICVNSVSVYPKSITLKVGNWYYATCAGICPTNATCRCVTWHSNNPSVASVNATSGYIFANAVGTAIIYATATDGSGCNDYLTVTVSNTVSVSSVMLNRPSLSLEKGQCFTLSATVCPNTASNKNLNWTSSDNSVATVSNGVVTAVANGSANITATATDGSGHCDCCTVTVTGNILVTSISISPSNKSMTVNASCYLYETVLPTNSTNPNVSWCSSNTSVASVNSSGLVYANGAGSATIYATAKDGSGVYGICNISVSSVAVNSVSIYPKEKTLVAGKTAILSAAVCPSNASNKSVLWTSSNASVATVGTHTGIVTAKSDGTTTITARTVSGGKTDTCTITVDSREKVIVKKDSHSFYVKFTDGKIWRFIGIDLSKRTDNYAALYPPVMNEENYDLLIAEEQRYLDNIKTTFSVEQIAYLYLLDPLGIEYYMRTNACDEKDTMSGEFLTFKDEVYEAIFGSSEKNSGRFYFKIIDGSVVYGRYVGYNRMDVYSNAEILFGAHTIFDVSSFWQSIGEFIFGHIPVISDILLGVEMYQALFFSGSIVSAMSDVASEFLEDYAQETSNTVLEKMLGWPKFVFDSFVALADAVVGAFELNNLNDMAIYSKIQEQNYRTIFENYDAELTIEEIISKCSNN